MDDYILKLYERKEGQYRPKECQSIRRGMKEIKPLANIISRHYRGHLVVIKTRTWQGISVATSSRYPMTIELFLSSNQIPPTHFKWEKGNEPLSRYKVAYVEQMFPITVCLC